MSVSCPRHGSVKIRKWDAAKGGPRWTCGEFLGVGAEGANRNGYCDWSTPVAQAQPQYAAPAAPAAAPASRNQNRLDAACAAIEAASRAAAPEASPTAVLHVADIFYGWIQGKVTGVPAAVPQPPPPPPPAQGPDDDIPF